MITLQQAAQTLKLLGSGGESAFFTLDNERALVYSFSGVKMLYLEANNFLLSPVERHDRNLKVAIVRRLDYVLPEYDQYAHYAYEFRFVWEEALYMKYSLDITLTRALRDVLTHDSSSRLLHDMRRLVNHPRFTRYHAIWLDMMYENSLWLEGKVWGYDFIYNSEHSPSMNRILGIL